jgi:NitT/TauT family transport system substrate-binding protein
MTDPIAAPPMLGRRHLLQVGAAGLTAVALAPALPRTARAANNQVRWVSPRGTIEVLDDYPYWVAKKFGYFGDIATTLEPGPLEATACVKLVDQGQSDMGYPSPGVFSLGLEQGMKLTSVWEMGALDVFDIAFRKGEKPADIKALQGKTVVLGSAGWQAICDPWFAQAGLPPGSVKYVEAGNGWAQALAQGKGDAALSWEGLRAQWKGQGLVFDYVLGRSFSRFPANSFVVRTKDLSDQATRALYERYLRGWAMGLEFGYHNPRAATHIVMQQFPGLASQMTPAVATESMMQLANVFRGDMSKRKGWGWHDLDSWSLFFKTLREIGQISTAINPADVITNDFVAGANTFDAAKVKADAEAYKLPPEYEAVNVEAIRADL